MVQTYVGESKETRHEKMTGTKCRGKAVTGRKVAIETGKEVRE